MSILSCRVFMERALLEAEAACTNNDIPVGAIVVYGSRVIASAHNMIIQNNDPTAHAEIVVLRQAGNMLQTHNLSKCDMYVTLEPCPMCAYAISLARIKRLYFAAYDPKRGAIYSIKNTFNEVFIFHKPEIYAGIMQTESEVLLKEFFSRIRKRNSRLLY